MRGVPFRYVLGVLLVGAAGQAMGQSVTLDLTFSDKALAELTSRQEGVVVFGYWSGDPAPGATLPETDEGRIFLMSEDVTLQPAPAQVVLGGNLPPTLLDQVTEVRLNVNAASARWSGDENLLACGFLDDTLAELAAAPQTIHCRLIGE